MDNIKAGNIRHGGMLDQAVCKYGGKKSEWLDLSTGINPYAYHVAEIDAYCWEKLPDTIAENNLLMAAGQAYAKDGELYEKGHIVAACGTQSLIQILPHLGEKSSKIMLTKTGYQEHAYCWRKAGHELQFAENLFESYAKVKYVVAINPHNPLGIQYMPNDLLKLADQLANKGGFLVVDEAFCDVTPELSLAAYAGREGLVVLRSFGKFYGLAGLRLGFLLGPSSIVSHVRNALGPWAVSGPALEIGTRALCDFDWAKNMRQQLTKNMKVMRSTLTRAGFLNIQGCDLFSSIYDSDCERIAKELAKRHILVRSFDEDKTLLRFGLTANSSDLNRLENALQESL